jgi:hypothetical protein
VQEPSCGGGGGGGAEPTIRLLLPEAERFALSGQIWFREEYFPGDFEQQRRTLPSQRRCCLDAVGMIRYCSSSWNDVAPLRF